MRQLADCTEDMNKLRGAGIRTTRQRLSIMRVIREGGRRHLTPESFHRELSDAGLRLSLATVYNTLNQFTDAGLLRRVGFGDRNWYCTNPAAHSHFFDEESGQIQDIMNAQPSAVDLPVAPEGYSVVGVEIIVRVRRNH